MLACSLGDDAITVLEDILSCGSYTRAPITGSLRITGTGQFSDVGVSIRQSTVTVILDTATITASIPLLISLSTASVILEGTNALVSLSESGSAVACSSQSNITFFESASGSLSASGGRNAAGIGASPDDSCHSITILNGSFAVNGGTGIGASPACNDSSALGHLAIRGGVIDAMGVLGAGIGTGFATNGSSTVEWLTISGGDINGTSPNDSGIGAGSANATGTTRIKALLIENGTINASGGFLGAGIGSGSAIGPGAQTIINTLTIVNGMIGAKTNGGPGIGAGCAKLDGSTVIGTITISGGHVTVQGRASAQELPIPMQM